MARQTTIHVGPIPSFKSLTFYKRLNTLPLLLIQSQRNFSLIVHTIHQVMASRKSFITTLLLVVAFSGMSMSLAATTQPPNLSGITAVPKPTTPLSTTQSSVPLENPSFPIFRSPVGTPPIMDSTAIIDSVDTMSLKNPSIPTAISQPLPFFYRSTMPYGVPPPKKSAP